MERLERLDDLARDVAACEAKHKALEQERVKLTERLDTLRSRDLPMAKQNYDDAVEALAAEAIRLGYGPTK